MTSCSGILSGTATCQTARAKRALRLLSLAALAILTGRGGAAQATTYETLYSFLGSPDGADPKGAVVFGSTGALYGTTFEGGTSVLGTVFVLTKPTGQPWKETVIHNFSSSEGEYPASTLVFGSTGTLYGTTISAGCCSGTIFEMAPPAASGDPWTETILHSFVYSSFSQNVTPNGTLLIGPGGRLYTTTQGSPDAPGGVDTGLVIALAPPATAGGAWTEYQLYTFGETVGGAGGARPLAGVASEGGSLFGTTYLGGDDCLNCGEVYELTPPATPGGAWTETTIHIFTGSPGDGAGSEAALTLGPARRLYGTTAWGGSGACNVGVQGCGTVFQLVPPSTPGGTWTESVIYSFTATNGDGTFPSASVVVGKDGSLYGTTQSGGSANLGTVFQLTPPATLGDPWTEMILHSFTGQSGDGATPLAGLTLNSAGVLYGTTSSGGTAGKGTVFAVTP